MRLHVVFTSEYPICLPWHYSQLLHGYLYTAIAKSDPKLGEFLHDRGFWVEAHRYKMLVFSRLFPRRARASKEGLTLFPPVHWWVGSPLAGPMEALAITLLSEGVAIIGDQLLPVERVEVEPQPDLSEEVLCEMISPLVASTGVLNGERLQKRFLSPDEPGFWQVLTQNLMRKASVLGLNVHSDAVVRFVRVGEWRSRLLLAQGTQVRGWEGRLLVQGDRQLLLVAYEAGLGERNAQGFGMFRIMTCDKASKWRESLGNLTKVETPEEQHAYPTLSDVE